MPVHLPNHLLKKAANFVFIYLFIYLFKKKNPPGPLFFFLPEN